MEFKDLKALADLRKVVELEKLVWGFDGEDVVPIPLFVIAIKRGGILIGAFDDYGEMVGFVYSLPGLRNGQKTQWSHMLGVTPGQQSSGVGYRLKCEQRNRALGFGVDLIEWTYDPLQAMNAYFNFQKLGAIVEEYGENVYGDTSSPLHRGNPTDRFVAQWWIRGSKVSDRIENVTSCNKSKDLWEVAAVNRAEPSGEWVRCGSVDLVKSERELAVELPAEFNSMLSGDPELAREWRTATREIFTTYFARGYRVVDFSLAKETNRGRYLLVQSEI